MSDYLNGFKKKQPIDSMWDEEFQIKLHNFFSLSDKRPLRASGRSTILAETLLKVALESHREIRYDIDHYVDARAIHPVSDEMLRNIERATTKFRDKYGVEINLEVNRRKRTFKAYQMGGGYLSTAFDFSPKPISKKEEKQFLNKKLLLLL